MKIIAIINIIQIISAGRYWRDPISAQRQIYEDKFINAFADDEYPVSKHKYRHI